MRYRDFDQVLTLDRAESNLPVVNLGDHPLIALVNVLAVAAMEILGPFCWSALILLFLVAELSSA